MCIFGALKRLFPLRENALQNRHAIPIQGREEDLHFLKKELVQDVKNTIDTPRNTDKNKTDGFFSISVHILIFLTVLLGFKPRVLVNNRLEDKQRGAKQCFI